MNAVVTILGMTEYNPRPDRKRHHWFRVNNTIAFSEKLEELSPAQKWFWIFLISLASFKQTDTVELNLSYFEKHSGVKKSEIQSALSEFEKRRMISVSAPNGNHLAADRIPNGALQYNTDNTIQTDNNAQPSVKRLSFDFETIYQKYPRKVGKSRGLLICKRQITTSELYADLERSVEIFSSHHKSVGTDPKYIPYFSTFMASWRDPLDPEFGKSDISQKSAAQEWLERIQAREALNAER